jgi:uncharacterized protein with NRDE domain
MCLVTLAIDQSRRYPLVLAFNRDDFLAHATSPMQWWSPGDGQPNILSGRSLAKDGAWLGLNTLGKLALVTSIRSREPDLQAPSRSKIVQAWLTNANTADRFWMETALSGYNGFNLIAADFRMGECFWGSNQMHHTTRLERGLYGLANAALDTPWPKVVATKKQVHALIQSDPDLNALVNGLFDAMAHSHTVAQPRAGTAASEWELQRHSAFSHSQVLQYATRSTTIVIAERSKKRLVTHVFERSFSGTDAQPSLVRFMLKDWPPRYSLDTDTPTLLGAEKGLQLVGGSSAQKTRVRTLLRPDIVLPKRLMQRGA